MVKTEQKAASVSIQSTASTVRIGAFKSVTSISLKETTSSKEKGETAENGEEKLADRPADAFTPEAFEGAWNEMAERFRSQGKESLYSTLHRKLPPIEDQTIVLEIYNSVQEKEIDESRGDILEMLREKLNNYSLLLETRRVEEKDEDVTLYTDRDKFAKMAEKNPSLLTLKNKLDLDFE